MTRQLNDPTRPLPAAGKRRHEHEWTHGADVQALWQKFGWTPPSKSRRDYSQPATLNAQGQPSQGPGR